MKGKSILGGSMEFYTPEGSDREVCFIAEITHEITISDSDDPTIVGGFLLKLGYEYVVPATYEGTIVYGSEKVVLHPTGVNAYELSTDNGTFGVLLKNSSSGFPRSEKELLLALERAMNDEFSTTDVRFEKNPEGLFELPNCQQLRVVVTAMPLGEDMEDAREEYEIFISPMWVY